MAPRAEDLLEEALNEAEEDVAEEEVIIFLGGWILGQGIFISSVRVVFI